MDIGTYEILVQVQVQVEVQVEVAAARSRLSCLQNQIQNTKQKFSQQVACVKGAVTFEKEHVYLETFPSLSFLPLPYRSKPNDQDHPDDCSLLAGG